LSRYIVGITGASGSIYGIRLIEELLKRNNEVHLVTTENGKKVVSYELEKSFNEIVDRFNIYNGNLHIHDDQDLFAPIASGSFKTDGMIILPCSMSTLGEISHGVSKNLLGRAADVCLKEKRRLIIVPREAPLSPIHLKNMLSLSELGVSIIPAMPGFYHRPKTIDDLVNSIIGRIMDGLGIVNDLYLDWGKHQ
jgi:4-hydroxy-3-polyprenylbenzoate decarboxylase